MTRFIHQIILKHEIFHNYIFRHIDQVSDIENIQYQFFMESYIIIINYYLENNNNQNNGYFLVSFKKTLLLIHESKINLLRSLFTQNGFAKFCFFPESYDIFIKNCEIQIKQIQFDEIFKKEISSFNDQITELNKIMPNIIISSITGYLIKQSYFKTYHILDCESPPNKKSLKSKFKESDFINLRVISSGSSFLAVLMYHIKYEELFVMKNPYILDNELPKLLEREIDNYCKIDFYRIPKFYGTIEGSNFPIISFIKGQSLVKIENLKLSLSRKRDIISQLLEIFNYLHGQGYVYRDLKPNNVLIDEEKGAYLIDFDRMIQKPEESKSPNDNNLHTIPDTTIHTTDFGSVFVAEEVNEGIISFSNDIFSLLMMIYYINNERIPDNESITNIRAFSKTLTISNLLSSHCICTYLQNNYIQDADSILFPKLKSISKIKDINECISQAIHYFLLAANQNHPRAQFNLGVIYYEGKYVTRDIDKAILYYSLAANQNHPQAQFNLGLIYYEGKYVTHDINKAILYFSFAANQNIPQAQFNLGVIYSEGKYVTRDINKAIHYYSLAADQNDPQAQFNLGLIYYEGKYVTHDISKAIHYFSFSADQNYPKAQFYLGLIYYEGKYFTRDINKAIHYYSLAADQNDPQAQYNLGLIYDEGKYVTRHINKAIHYYSLAEDQNDLNAQFNLGLIYYEGKYVIRDINKAIYYFSLAANQNIPQAQFNLGLIYYEGKYVTRDIDKAIYYFSLAANQNDL